MFNIICTLLQTLSNIVIAIGTALGVLKFVFKVEWTIKSPKLKGLPISERIRKIQEKRDFLDKVSEESLNKLEQLKVDDVSLYFTLQEDRDLFMSHSHGTPNFKLDGSNVSERQENYFKFYNKLSKRGRIELKDLEIKLFEDR